MATAVVRSSSSSNSSSSKSSSFAILSIAFGGTVRVEHAQIEENRGQNGDKICPIPPRDMPRATQHKQDKTKGQSYHQIPSRLGFWCCVWYKNLRKNNSRLNLVTVPTPYPLPTSPSRQPSTSRLHITHHRVLLVYIQVSTELGRIHILVSCSVLRDGG